MPLVAFDFDGTLSDSEMTVLLGEQCGVADKVARITERAMNDEIDYATSLRERCALFEGLPDEEAQAAFEAVVLRDGAADIIRRLNGVGVYTAILTGGFARGVAAALEAETASVDDVLANHLPVENGQLTGSVDGPLIEGTKDEALAELAASRGVAMADTIAVGDGANDRPMLEAAGLGVGFDPKSSVAPACDVIVDTMAGLENLFQEESLI